MFEHITDFTAWPILTGILVGYVANRIMSGEGKGCCIKDLYVDDKPFLALIASLLKKGVEVRLIHAKEPGTAWREDHEKHPILYDGMERVLCPRVHFKLIIIDSTIAYVGSANLTGAGMGMKSPKKRNFEAGILTDDPEMLEAAIEQFDNVWIGKFCKDCGRREYCSDPIK